MASGSVQSVADLLGPVGCGMVPQRIGLFPVRPADVKLDWDLETLEARSKPRALRRVPPSVPEQFVQRVVLPSPCAWYMSVTST